MDNPRLLALVLLVTVVGGFLVVWSAVLAMNVDRWFPNAIGYLGVAIICLVLLIPLWYRYERKPRESI